jgi:hypothetical protein
MNELLTNQPLPEVSKTLSARQIAFREIKKLFGATGNNTKSVHPKKQF